MTTYQDLYLRLRDAIVAGYIFETEVLPAGQNDLYNPPRSVERALLVKARYGHRFAYACNLEDRQKDVWCSLPSCPLTDAATFDRCLAMMLPECEAHIKEDHWRAKQLSSYSTDIGAIIADNPIQELP